MTEKWASQRRYRERHPEQVRESVRRSYHKNKEKYKPKKKASEHKRYLEVRKKVLTYYGGNPPRCACCGETQDEFLTIDHISGGGTKHRKRIRRPFYRWLLENNFPEGYRVLCMNCNHSLGQYGYCPHQEVTVQ